MKKIANFCCAFFIALGAMISFSPRDVRMRPDNRINPDIGIERHFNAAWGYLGKAVKSYEK